jgi:hypothetical protein
MTADTPERNDVMANGNNSNIINNNNILITYY